MKLFKLTLFIAAGFLMLALTGPYARADYLYKLDQSGSGLTLPSSGYFGTVDLKTVTGGVLVSVALAPNVFANTGAGGSGTGTGVNGPQFLLNGSSDVYSGIDSSLSSSTATLVSGTVNQPGLNLDTLGYDSAPATNQLYGKNGTTGFFNIGLYINGIGTGTSSPKYNAISFTVTGVTISDLTGTTVFKNGTPGTAIFAADVGVVDPLTGSVIGTGLAWTNGPPSTVPEPSTLLLLGFVLLGWGLFYRSRRQKA